MLLLVNSAINKTNIKQLRQVTKTLFLTNNATIFQQPKLCGCVLGDVGLNNK